MSERLLRLLNPMILAVSLTGLVCLAGLVAPDGGPHVVLEGWVNGFTSLFAFAMQMILMLALGHAAASAPTVLKGLQGLAGWIARQSAPAFWIVLATAACSWLHWGLGLIAGGLIARAAAEANEHGGGREAVRYAAAAYGGFLVWHGGLSGSAPMLVATPDHFLADAIGSVAVSQTVFSGLNLTLLILVPLVTAVAVAKLKIADAPLPRPRDQAETAESDAAVNRTAAWIGAALGLAAVAGMVTGVQPFSLNMVILLLFAAAMILHQDLERFQEAARLGLSTTVGIALQFPLYGAIMGVMRETGMATAVAEFFIQGVSEQFLPVAVFLSAGFVNVVVPSGGGQWAVQGPIVVDAAAGLGVPTAKAIIAFAWGDAWTNLIQPFWALPLLALTGVRAEDVLRVTGRLLLVSGIMACAVLLVMI